MKLWPRRPHQNGTSKEVSKLQKKTHRSADKAEQDIQRLNELLKANGITFRIHIATKGH